MMHDKEMQDLQHDPVPGYRTAFYVVCGLSLLYLLIIFLKP